MNSPHHLEIDLYETDQSIISPLAEVMENCRKEMKKAGHILNYKIHRKDFILSTIEHGKGLPLFDSNDTGANKYDAVIMNPPYFKLPGNSKAAVALKDVVHGQPNIYALFMAAAAEQLKDGGELVAITPRSFSNGLYFRHFRMWFFKRMQLTRAHLFHSRKEAFKEAKILQESLITLTRKGNRPSRIVTLSFSVGRTDLPESTEIRLPSSKIIDSRNNDTVIRFPESVLDAEIIDIVEGWKHTASEIGLRVSTGPVVSFRARKFLIYESEDPTDVPLIHVGNVKPNNTVWPLPQNGKPTVFRLTNDSRSLILPTRNYVLIRRFSAKEEKKRLTASPFLRSHFKGEFVALENHLNYVYHCERELSEEETIGLSAIYNSNVMDRYFRTISGNTQVNATELRTMPLPNLSLVEIIGRRILKDHKRKNPEAIVLDTLKISRTLSTTALEHSN